MTASTPRPPLLDVAGLRVTYGGVVAVSDVDLQIDEGTIYGLIGPNGAGKTSMVDALTGYTRPAAGRITFNGRDVGALRPYRRRMSRPATRRRYRWAGASWSASAGRSPGSPGWSCWTNPRPGSTPTRASSWGAGCAPCPKSTA
jgi:energy-coupling factor transporter ATP-binding protein EcfA2